MRDPGYQGDAAAFGGQVEKTLAFGEGVVDELAEGGSEEADAIDASVGEEVDEFESGSVIGLPRLWMMRGDGGREDTGETDLTGGAGHDSR